MSAVRDAVASGAVPFLGAGDAAAFAFATRTPDAVTRRAVASSGRSGTADAVSRRAVASVTVGGAR
ncbi:MULTISPECIES: hypothetical protein [Microbacterium]|uniref:hypothetical protein n=1 Tax=Microbacterium TaxID=33882 RepID=UPI002786D8E0|nr:MULTISPECIES: hypothetical protein [Microbacterium]MDQ1084475.1 hypothetical protein [Microbacterium sp. SORGH_AS_0344]MDQ1170248.1 hypothetical protein [Microbacterium proteolyticum]